MNKQTSKFAPKEPQARITLPYVPPLIRHTNAAAFVTPCLMPPLTTVSSSFIKLRQESREMHKANLACFLWCVKSMGGQQGSTVTLCVKTACCPPPPPPPADMEQTSNSLVFTCRLDRQGLASNKTSDLSPCTKKLGSSVGQNYDLFAARRGCQWCTLHYLFTGTTTALWTI